MYHIVRILTRKTATKDINFNKKQFFVDLSNPIFIAKQNTIYFLDIDTGKQLTFEFIEHNLSPDELDIIVGQKIIRELTRGVLDNRKQALIYIGLGLLIGGLIVGLIMSIYYSNEINSIYDELLNGSSNQPNPPIIPLGGMV